MAKSSVSYPVHRENSQESSIFDDGFDFEELMLGHAPLVSAHTSFNGAVQHPNHQASMTLLSGCDNQRNNTNSFVSNSCFPDEEAFLNTFSNTYDILDEFKVKSEQKSSALVLKQSDEVASSADKDMFAYDLAINSDEDKNIQRRRDYSLSNDSGVEGCGVIDASSIPSNSDPNYTSQMHKDSDSSIILNSEANQFSNIVRESATPCGRLISSELNSNKNNNTTICYSKLQVNRCVSNDSEPDLNQLIDSNDSRKGSIDSDAGVNGEIYGGGEMFSPDRFPNGDLSDVKNASKKTAYNEKWGVKVLKAWCAEVKLNPEFEKQSATELNDMLCRFWSEVRKSNGDYYGRNSLFNLRAMINKHLKGKPYCVAFDIVTDERFRTSNEKLESQLKLLKGIGRTITHKQPISLCDLRKMYDSNVLGTSNPLALLRKVWFEITLHFCHKGSEAQEKLKKSSFNIYHDLNGLRYVARIIGMNDADEIRMYETGGELCPVRSYELYLSKLHAQQPRLFQQPRRKSSPDSPMWYGKAPIGEKALQQMMANISNAARLSKRYTNHCVRTTALEQFSSSRRKSGGGANRSDSTQKNTNRNSQHTQFKDTIQSNHPANPYNNSFPSLSQPKSQRHELQSMTSNQILADCASLISPPIGHESTIASQSVNGVGIPSIYPKDVGNTDVSTLFETDNHRSIKRQYQSDFPSYSPPPYVDSRLDQLSPPNKRLRFDVSAYNPSYESSFQPTECFQFTDLDNQKRYYENAVTESDMFHNHSSYKNYSDDSGTGRSVVSPTPIIMHDDPYHVYSMPTPSTAHSVSAISRSCKDLISPLATTDKDLAVLSSTGAYSGSMINAAFSNRPYCSSVQHNVEFDQNLSGDPKFNHYLRPVEGGRTSE
uniref:Uncharacterized protein LOC100186276 n=1 Tax=Phallusia mammillata TaxID=59560 RepID=A0A6F9DJA8_9ASCI|nr:uncharacterized protein LOC100186276 [Phallusia mammillata]